MPFGDLSGSRVFVEEKYLDCVDKGYIVASVRDRLLNSGADLAASAEDADVVMEIRSGGVGTDNVDSFVGVPGLALPGPVPFELPELRIWSKESQTGMAKIGIVAFDAKDGRLLGRGGKVLAKSDDVNTTVLGVGPFYSGSIRQEVKVATAGDKKGLDALESGVWRRRGRGRPKRDRREKEKPL